MSSSQAASSLAKPFRTLLLVICGKGGPLNDQASHRGTQGHARPTFQVNDNFGSCPQLEVQILEHPTQQELGQTLGCLLPDIVFFHADLSTDNGALVLGEVKFSQPEMLLNLFPASKFPDLVYLEANAGRLGPALCKAGVPHVVYWDYAVSQLVAYHFCQSLVAALRSARAGIQEAFDLASSSMLMHCTYNRVGRSSNGETKVFDLRPLHSKRALDENHHLSQGPKVEGESEHDELAALPTILQIYDLRTEVRLLVCTEPNRMDKLRLRALETGLSALLIMEASGIRLLHRVSAPPPTAAAAHARGIVTMRCDLCTSSYARIPLLVSGSAHTCFDDQLLESSIKKEMVKKDGLVRLSANLEDCKAPVAPLEQRRSGCIASGALVVEIRIVTHYWALQMLRQLSSQPSYRSLAALGIAGVDGIPVAAFCKHDADHLNSLLEKAMESGTNVQHLCGSSSVVPKWLCAPLPSRKRSRIQLYKGPYANETLAITRQVKRKECTSNGYRLAQSKRGEEDAQKGPCVAAAMKPVPHAKQRDAMPYSAAVIAGAHAGWSMKLPLTNGICGKAGRSGGGVSGHSGAHLLGMHGQAATDGMPSQLSFPLELPLVKPHGCSRKPMSDCSEDEFLKDVVEFLISRGHGRLVPPAGIDAFPEVVLNAKRLDLYNLYKEVVSRGGFHVGNGINWKGQVFSKMQNHTFSNKMTGVGNALKKHYETYLLEYEFAHDDVDGECCIICHSGAEGDWVNCGVCGEWAHFGCDKRVGLATFKEYAKADGVEYICPRCSAGNGRTGRRSKLKTGPDVAVQLQ